jgi:hypothetical protein
MTLDPNTPLRELLSVTLHPGLATMSEAELLELAAHCRERLVGKANAEAKERDRAKRQLAKARKAAERQNSP